MLEPYGAWRKRLTGSLKQDVLEQGNVPYRAYGGSKTALLYIHATPGGYDQGLSLCQPLVDAGHALLCPARSGYLGAPGALSPEEQADAFAYLVSYRGLGKVVVVTWSGGGPTALQFALRHPDKTAALILYSAVTQKKTAPPAWTSIFYQDFFQWCLETALGYPSLLTRFLAWLRLDSDWVTSDQARLDLFFTFLETIAPVSLRKDGLLNDFHWISTLPVYPVEKIACPTLVLHCPTDTSVPSADAEFVATGIPGATYHVQADGGHILPLGKDYAETQKVLFNFLAGV